MTKTEQENLAICVFKCDQHEREIKEIQEKMDKFIAELREKIQEKQCQTKNQ